MRYVLVDFETYFDAKYSLKNLSTSEYIRDPQFKVHGAAIRTASWATSRWLSGDVLTAFIRETDWANTCLVAHHAQFDGFILRETYGVVPAESFCTLDASRATLQGLVKGHGLDFVAEAVGLPRKLTTLEQFKGVRELTAEQEAQLAEYACRDAEIGWSLFELFHGQVSEVERALMSLTHRMFIDPVLRVDIDRAKAAKVKEANDNAAVIAASGATLKELRSAKFADKLIALGVEIKTKVTPKGKTAPAFAKSDQFMKDLLLHENDVVRRLAEARVVAKAANQGLRADRLINAGTTGDCTLPVYYYYFGAGTGRWSGGNRMNLQNLTAGGELRKSIVAPDGYVVGVADSGQIECRVNAWLWDETWLLDLFRAGRDPYCEFGPDVYNRTITKADPVERFVLKSMVLGLGFYMGWRRFQTFLKIGARGAPIVHMADEECERLVRVYRGKNRQIVNGWNLCKQMIEFLAYGSGAQWFGKIWVNADTQSVRLPSGREIIYPAMQEDDNGDYFYIDGGDVVFIHPGGMCENLVQAIARDIIGWQMLNISKRLRVVMMTHDEIVALLPVESAQADWEWMRDQMLIAPPWCSDIPLSAEGGFDVNYSK